MCGYRVRLCLPIVGRNGTDVRLCNEHNVWFGSWSQRCEWLRKVCAEDEPRVGGSAHKLGHVSGRNTFDADNRERRRRLEAIVECPECGKEVECWAETEEWTQCKDDRFGRRGK